MNISELGNNHQGTFHVTFQFYAIWAKMQSGISLMNIVHMKFAVIKGINERMNKQL